MYTLVIEPLLSFDMDKIKLVEQFKRYVKHAGYVWTHTTHKDRNKRLDYVNELLRIGSEISQYQTTSEVCEVINAQRHKLQYILPDPSNSSYESSLSRLMEIMKFCREKRHLPEYQLLPEHVLKQRL